ncbi:hypothetical protein BGW42_004060 [Actinomortierella wolfii]|nr:hypothetical protein BGW42_004060 [Actinomortierella wolfii]
MEPFTALGLRNHKKEVHDGDRRRTSALICFCGHPVKSRKGLQEHMRKCKDVSALGYPWSCPYCEGESEELKVTTELIDHVRHCFSWPVDPKSGTKEKREFDADLFQVTKNAVTASFVKSLFMPSILKLNGGKSAFALVFGSNATLFRGGSQAFVEALDFSDDEPKVDTDLELVLKSHPFGQLVDPRKYQPLKDDEDFLTLPFVGNSEELSRRLQDCLIQSVNDVLWCLKVEVYGREVVHDPHAIPHLARPRQEDKAFTVVNENLNGADQLMIGAVTWNALITMAVILTSGEIVVGPHNTAFLPHEGSHACNTGSTVVV